MTALTLGLIGNPNSGKTTLFNQLTGSRQRVGNWAGVTVERKEGAFHTVRHAVRLVDLPGTYSLTSVSAQASLDEQIACRYIASGEVDVLVNVVDAANLERNLYLTVQLREMGIPCIVALNMLDIARSQRIRIDIDGLARRLGCPVVPLVSTRADGIDELKAAIDSYSSRRRRWRWTTRRPSRRRSATSWKRALRRPRPSSRAGWRYRRWKATSSTARRWACRPPPWNRRARAAARSPSWRSSMRATD